MYEVVIVYKDREEIDSVWNSKDSASYRLRNLASEWSGSETAFGHVRERWEVFVVRTVDMGGTSAVDSLWSSRQDASNRLEEIKKDPKYCYSHYEVMPVNRIV